MKKPLYSILSFSLLSIALLAVSFSLLTNGVFCILVVLVMLVLLAKEVYPPELLMGGALVIIVLANYFTPTPFFTLQEAFRGFSNQGVITIGALFIVAAAAKNTGLFETIAYKVLGKTSNTQKSLARLSLPLAGLSAFINNTPIVSIFLPILREWAIKNNLSPSKFLIPLSYLTIFGGTCTLIGTSTNLVVSGLALEAGLEPLSFFSFSYIGLPCAAVGILYLIFVGHRLLPENKEAFGGNTDSIKKYLIEMFVEKNSKLAGLSIDQAGLRDLDNLFLFEVRRGDRIYAPIKREFILKEEDCLVFSGSRDEIISLPKLSGLTVPSTCRSFDVGENAQMIEVVISASSPLKGKTLDDVWFNRKYNAAVLAVHRNGETIEGSISTLPLNTGDTLLLVAGMGFRRIWQHSTDFYLVSPIRSKLHRPKLAPLSALIILGMVLLPAFNIVPILYTSLTAAMLLVMLKGMNSENVLSHVDWNVLTIIASSFGISAALEGSGASALIAQQIAHYSMTLGPYAALFIFYLVTNILTETITNNAAAALIFPIGVMTSKELGCNPMPFIMVIATAASASFMTPIGYQTNMIVYGPGGYKFKNYLKIGTPLNLIFLVGACVIAPIVWPF